MAYWISSVSASIYLPIKNLVQVKTVNGIQKSVTSELCYSASRCAAATNEIKQGQGRGFINDASQLNILKLVCLSWQKLNPSCDKGN